ncbi:MAG: hypothetical protein GY846_09095 [Deltaproteobacteria bacterium]|nr:hypothetical protein [Deltaproteobacteria bacterium]
MFKAIIAWMPFLVLLGIFSLFKMSSFATRYYNLFLLLIVAFGFLLVIIYKFLIKRDVSGGSD